MLTQAMLPLLEKSAEHTGMRSCVVNISSIEGLSTPGTACRLSDAGVARIEMNLNTTSDSRI